MDISIIIVNYNSRNLLYNCINSILEKVSYIEYEIVVVDNNSTDDSFIRCETFVNDRLKMIQAGQNLGFAKANNLGVKSSVGKILHFLNPDTELDSSIVSDYQRVIGDLDQNIHNVYVNPMRDKDGTTYYGKNWIPDTWNYLTYLFCRSKTKWYYIGATVIMSRHVFDIVGGWNEKFFMYEEDTDLFYRINNHKINTIELPSVIYHYGGGTSLHTFSGIQREALIQKSSRIYFKNNNLSLINYWVLQSLMILSFIRKPQRAMWQIKAIIKSFD